MARHVLGLDVGGANLKAARHGGAARSRPFALWKQPDRLAGELAALAAGLPEAAEWAVTMTGELCDCFATRAAGVRFILDAVGRAAGGRAVRVWSHAGRFVTPDEARNDPLTAAAGNWFALATFAGRFAPAGRAVLIDVGSTTTDVVRLRDGVPRPLAHDDPGRLRTRELVYTGVRRTPACAVLGRAGAAEFFATTLDAYLVLGMAPEDPADADTADGRPATRAHAYARLARMLCGDAETVGTGRLDQLADLIRRRQMRAIDGAVLRHVRDVGRGGRLRRPTRTFVVSGSGEFLARRVLDDNYSPDSITVVSLSDRLGPEASAAAPAYAVATLLAESPC